jgi:hypothetical protein
MSLYKFLVKIQVCERVVDLQYENICELIMFVELMQIVRLIKEFTSSSNC